KLIALVVWCCGVGAIAASVHWDDIISRVLLKPYSDGIRVLGLATYPIYLLHDVFGAAVMRWLRTNGCSQYGSLFGSVAIVILVSIIITLYLEPPLKRVLSKIV